MILGYGLAASVKPLFPLAKSVNWVFTARFADRVGKGIRGSPRDALVAEITPPEMLGSAYGLRQAMDSAGALAGPMLAIILMSWLSGNVRMVMWLAVIPAFIAVFTLLIFVREPERTGINHPKHTFFNGNVKLLPRRYWHVVLLGAVFSMARFSEAFLVLRAHGTGLSFGYVPMVMVVMNAFYAFTAYPAGAAADRINQHTLLFAGLMLLVGADLILAFASTPVAVLAGAAMWGLHMALTQGLLSKLVADNTPADLKGTGFGIFNLASGISLLMASAVAGLLWKTFGPSATFLAGAVFGTVSAVGLAMGGNKV